MRTWWRKPALAVAACAASVAAIVLWPAGVGGSTSYLTTHGSSMEPALRRGDLALVRKADSYRVGDVVAYHSKTLDTMVLHRIVGVRADAYVLQGDNNSWLDPDEPRHGAVTGKLWLRIPGGGLPVARLRQVLPLGSALLFLVCGGAATARRRRPRGGPRPMFDKQTPGALVQTWRVAAAAAALALACAALAIVAYSRPATRPATDEIAYVHRGDFSYGAAAPSGPVYEKGVVTTGDPVYLRLVSRVDVRFKYRFEAGGPHEVAGTVGLHAEVSDSTGWRRSVPLGEPVPFAGSEAEVGAPFDIGRAQALVAEVQALTGVSGGTYAVALVPEVSVTGKVADHELGDTFAPRLEFVLDPLQLRLNVSGSEGRAVADALSPRTEGSVTRRVSRPAELGVGGIAIGVGQARNVAALLGVPAVIASAVALGMLRRRWRGEPSLIELRHGRRLVPVVDAHREGNRAHVEVASMADLVRLAERHDSLVLHQPTDEADAYVFTADRVVYRYLARGSLRRSG